MILKRASASRPSGEWNDDDFDVLADGAVVGRVFNVNAAPLEKRSARDCGTPRRLSALYRRLTNGTGKTPAVRRKGRSARLPGGLLRVP